MNDNIKKQSFDLLKTIGLAILLYFIVNLFVFTIRVEGASMAPTLETDNILLTAKDYFFDEYKLGDIIIFDNDYVDKTLIKRVIGKPGDVVRLENKKVYINGQQIDEPYLLNDAIEELVITVGKDEYFVMGDNRLESFDSRFEEIGLIDKKLIKGKILFFVVPSAKFVKWIFLSIIGIYVISKLSISKFTKLKTNVNDN